MATGFVDQSTSVEPDTLQNARHISSDSIIVGNNPSTQAFMADYLLEVPRILGDEPFFRFILISVIVTMYPLGQFSGSLLVNGKVTFVPKLFAAS